jgi:glycosyltransferase involved in cell wall biosynthesis
MKFLIYGNAPHVSTGYGVQVGHLCTQLKKHGHDVAVACTFGHQVGVREYPTPYGPVRLYPSGWLENSLDVLRDHAMHFFAGDPQGGYIIPVTDMWVLNPVALEEFKVLAWTPVDHWPVPADVLKFFHKNAGARCLAMSEFGQRQMVEAGLDAECVPLAVDCNVYKPTATVLIDGEEVPARDLLNIPAQAGFVVAMVAMNKDPQDRKNFNGAFRAFGRFWREHQDAVLYVHSDQYGIAGSMLNLGELAKHAAIPPHAIVFSNTYALQMGFSAQMMAALYSAADVLLCPSKGEGFGVPMIEAQACGTPVIASDFTSQSELVGAGWKISGQLEFDAKQNASYLQPSTSEIFSALMEAYDHRGNANWSAAAIEFAQQYDVEAVWERHWAPVLASLESSEPAADKPKIRCVDVIVPYMRSENRTRFAESLDDTSDSSVLLILGQEEPDSPVHAEKLQTYSQNVNAALKESQADWVLIVGDDVEFTPGWLEAARELSDRYDVIGTNDSEPGRVRNPLVANGSHADHFFVRRSYIDEVGASLEGPGILMPECYRHWYTDKEVIELAKARGVFAPCLDSVIIHHHPGYDGREDAREADPVYMAAVESSEQDRKTWMGRAPIIAGYRGQR